MADPTAQPEPFSTPPAERDNKRSQAERERILAYKRCFSTASGMAVLADLKVRFQFDRWEADNSDDPAVILRRVYMHGPLWHIQKQMDTVFREGKPQRKTTP